MTKTTFEQIFDAIDSKPLQLKVKSVGLVIGQVEKIILNLHQLQLRYWMDYQTAIHKDEWWTEKEITQKEAKALFDQFLQLYREAYEEPFDNYTFQNRTGAFNKWKLHMKFFFKKNKSFSDKEFLKHTGKDTKK